MPKTSPKSKPGRPSKFEKSQEIIRLLARRGFTDVEMSQCLHITEVTLNNWKKKDPDFFKSLKDWKKKADHEVERSLYERACGYEHPETKAQFVNGKEGGEWKTLDMVKHYPPDTTAMIFWLKNRQPDKWRDRQEHDHTVTFEDRLKSIHEKRNG